MQPLLAQLLNYEDGNLPTPEVGHAYGCTHPLNQQDSHNMHEQLSQVPSLKATLSFLVQFFMLAKHVALQ